MAIRQPGWRNWRGSQLQKAIKSDAKEAVRVTGHVVLEAAKQEVPHDEGTLMRSGGVEVVEGKEPMAVVHFGGGPGTGHPLIPYALRWHEEMANFQKGRKNRYLADPLNRLGPPTLIKALQQQIGRTLR